MTLHSLNGRLAKLEQAQDADDTEPEIIIRVGASDEPPLKPGTRVLRIAFGGPARWEVIGEGDDA